MTFKPATYKDKIMLSQYCKECLKFRNQHCKGKEGGIITTTFFGQKSQSRLSGLTFCKQYEFDIRLMPKSKTTVEMLSYNDSDFDTCPNNKGRAKKVKQKRTAAKQKRVAAAIDVAAAEEVDIGEKLSSSDFDDLLI